MGYKKYLSKKQLAVIEDLFSSNLDEGSVLEKHKVSRHVYNKWLLDKTFSAEVERRMKLAYRQSELIIAQYASVAAAKLVELTESEREETARRACLDIIGLPKLSIKEAEKLKGAVSESKKPVSKLPKKVARRLLAVLAEEKNV
jgi:hypothetical protein